MSDRGCTGDGRWRPCLTQSRRCVAGLDQAVAPVGATGGAGYRARWPRVDSIDVELLAHTSVPGAGPGPWSDDRAAVASSDPPVSPSPPDGVWVCPPRPAGPTPLVGARSQLRRRTGNPADPAALGRSPSRMLLLSPPWVCLLVTLGPRSGRWVAVRSPAPLPAPSSAAGSAGGFGFGFSTLFRSSCFSGGVCRFPLWPASVFGAGRCGGRRLLWPSSSGLVSPFGVDQVCLGAVRAWANRSMRRNHVFDIWLGHSASRAGGS